MHCFLAMLFLLLYALISLNLLQSILAVGHMHNIHFLLSVSCVNTEINTIIGKVPMHQRVHEYMRAHVHAAGTPCMLYCSSYA